MKRIQSNVAVSSAAGLSLPPNRARGQRRRRGLRAALGLAAALLVLGNEERAEACSCAGTYRNELQVGAGRVPANAGGIVWWFGQPAFEVSRSEIDLEAALEQLRSLVTLERWDGTEFRDVATRIEPLGEDTYLIRSELAWSSGERYRLSVDAGASYGDASKRSRSSEFVVVDLLEQAQEPLALDLTRAQSGKVGLVARDGSCGATHDAVYVDIDFAAPEGGGDWPGELLLYTTYVDGDSYRLFTSFCDEPVPGASWFSRTGNRLVAACDEGGRVLAEGKHTARMEARLAGADVVFSTEELSFELRCPAPAPQDVASAPEEGCSAAPVGHAGGGHGVAALAALALAAVTRTRRRP